MGSEELKERASWENPTDIGLVLKMAGSGAVDLFWSHVSKSSGCWSWSLGHSKCGYARVTIARKMLMAHRVAYFLVNGDIPGGMVIDHTCRNRGCVNPDHMRVVTNKQNILAKGATSPSARNARKTHCTHGHPYNEENTRRQGSRRYCRACERRKAAERYARLRLFPSPGETGGAE